MYIHTWGTFPKKRAPLSLHTYTFLRIILRVFISASLRTALLRICMPENAVAMALIYDVCTTNMATAINIPKPTP